MSNGTFLSLVRHWTHGNFANVVIPAKTASAVTDTKIVSYSVCTRARPRREHGLTRVVTRVRPLVWEPDIVQGHLIFIVVAMTHRGRPEGQHEQWQKLRLENHSPSRAKSIHYGGLFNRRDAPPFMCDRWAAPSPLRPNLLQFHGV